MAPANLELVRSIYAAWEVGDFTRAEWAHAEIEFVMADGPLPGKWKGLSGMAEIAREGLDAWQDARITLEEYRVIDSGTVLVLDHRFGSGKTSGLELPDIQSKGAHLFRIQDGKVMELINYWDRERALADLGLTPEAS